MENFWSSCLHRFEKELSTQQFSTWIKPLLSEIDGNTLRVIAPNRFVMQWVKERFLKKIEQFASESGLDIARIELILNDSDLKISTSASNISDNAYSTLQFK